MTTGGKRGLLLTGVTALAIAIASQSQAGIFNNPVQDCDPDPGHRTSGRWYQNGQPGELNNVVTGFRPMMPGQEVISENTGTDAGGDPVNNTIQCSSGEVRWRLFLSKLGDRADTARVDAVGLQNPAPYEPLPRRIEARLSGGKGSDLLLGHPGKNKLNGGQGPDELQAFGGPDLLIGGTSKDVINAGAGRDKVRALDGVRDKVNCGAGRDRAKIDRVDDLSGCEIRVIP